MRYFVTYLVYIAVIARAAGWNQDMRADPTCPVWPLLALFGVFLFSERAVTRRVACVPSVYNVV